VIGSDNADLRIEPLNRPGSGLAGVLYGPYTRRIGLAFAAFLTIGHNTPQVGKLPRIQTKTPALGPWE